MKAIIEDIFAFIKELVLVQFDKLLLIVLFLSLMGITIHLIHDAEMVALNAGVAMTSTDFVNWSETQSGTVLGALLTLTTGAVIKTALSKSQDKSITETSTITTHDDTKKE